MTELTVHSVRTPEEISVLYAAGHWSEEFLTDLVDAWADSSPGRTFIYDGNLRLTWRDVQERSLALAGSLRDLGITHGDRVAVQLPNWHEFLITYLAIARIGAVTVPIMHIYRDREVAHVLAHTGAVAYVYPPEFRGFDFRSMAESIRPELPDLRWRIVVRAADGGVDGELTFDDLVRQGGSPSADEFPAPSPDDHHLIVFTSGTESKAKGCVHTWNTLAFTPRNQVGLHGFGRDSIELIVSPITHSTGLASGALKPLVGGGAICLMEVWEPNAALDLIDEVGCTHITAATPFLMMLVDAAKKRGSGGAALEVFLCGGAPVPAVLVRETSKVLKNCHVVTAYGQSEVLILTTADLNDDEERVATSDGKPVSGVEVQTIDMEGGPAKPGEEGEVCYRSPGQILGYWHNPEADRAASLPGGWRRSGDLGRVDPDGYLRVTGRTKDMVLRGGMNISSREIEELLIGHPSVAAAAVVGVPDPVLGERVGAALVPATDEGIDVETVLTYLRDECKVAVQKLPERVIVTGRLPMNVTGKVLKFQLAKQLADQ